MFRFSLRALFAVVTAFCCSLALEGPWIAGRWMFLREQESRRQLAVMRQWLATRSAVPSSLPAVLFGFPNSNVTKSKPAPRRLRMSFQRGYSRVNIIVPAADSFERVENKIVVTGVLKSHPDYQAAKSLFPEAEIRVYVESPAGVVEAAAFETPTDNIAFVPRL